MSDRSATGNLSLRVDSTTKNTPANHAIGSSRQDSAILTAVLADGASTNQVDRAWERPSRTLAAGASEEIDLFDFDGIDVGFEAGNDRVGQPLICEEVVSVVVKQESGAGRLEIEPSGVNGWTPIGIHTVANGGALSTPGFLAKHLPHADAFPITNLSSQRVKFTANGGAVVYSVYLHLRAPSFLPIDINDAKIWLRADIGAKAGGARSFLTANSEYFSVADTADLDFDTGDYTIECWAKRHTDSSVNFVLSKGSAAEGSYQIQITTAGIVEVIIRDSAASQLTHSSDTTINDTDWHHIVWVVDRSGNSEIYIDGSLDALVAPVSAINLSISNGDALEIGRNRNQAGYANGDIARVRLWKGRLLTATEITKLYNSGAGLFHSELGTDFSTSLVASYDLNEVSGNAIERVNSYDGTDTNTVTAADGPGFGQAVNNDPIQRWVDRSKSRKQFDQSTAAKKPLWIASAINSLPAIRFDGSDDLLRLGENYLLSAAGTIVVVYQLTAALQDDQTILSIADEATNVHRLAFRGYRDVADPNINSVQTENDVADDLIGDTVITTATTYIVVLTSSGTSYAMRVNGAGETLTINTGGNTGDWAADLTVVDNVVIGALKSNSEQDHFKGDIAELAVFDRELTATEIGQIESYMATRYGVTLP